MRRTRPENRGDSNTRCIVRQDCPYLPVLPACQQRHYVVRPQALGPQCPRMLSDLARLTCRIESNRIDVLFYLTLENSIAIYMCQNASDVLHPFGINRIRPE